METKKTTPLDIVEAAFADLNARLVQLHDQQSDLFDNGITSYRSIKLIKRYIVSIPSGVANKLFTVSEALYSKIDWGSLGNFLFPGNDTKENWYIDETTKYSAYVAIIEEEEPALKDFFNNLPALIQLKVDSGADQVNSATEKIKLNYSVDDIGALLAILFDSKIIVPTNKADIFRLVANNFSSKMQQNISASSLRNKCDTPEFKSLEMWGDYFKEHSTINASISTSINTLKGKI